MIDAIPVWVSLLAFIGLQTAVGLYLVLPLYLQKRAGGKVDRETRRQVRNTALTVSLVLFFLLDPFGILRWIGFDPMLWLAGLVVWCVQFLRSI